MTSFIHKTNVYTRQSFLKLQKLKYLNCKFTVWMVWFIAVYCTCTQCIIQSVEIMLNREVRARIFFFLCSSMSDFHIFVAAEKNFDKEETNNNTTLSMTTTLQKFQKAAEFSAVSVKFIKWNGQNFSSRQRHH